MSNRLSHSAMNRYSMCSESYRLHYIEKIRPNGTSSPLMFGAALDEALNCLLLNKGNAEEQFERSFTTQKINGAEVYLPTSTQVRYSKADLDFDLFTEADAERLTQQAKSSGLSQYSDYTSAIKDLRKKETLTELEQTFYNLAHWLSLYRKGLLMLVAYRSKVLPLIKNVRAVQQEFSLKNQDGDEVVGLIDFVADIDGHDTPVILDNKTAGRPYEADSVAKSEQLTLYMHALGEEYGTRKAGYIVLLKNVNKNKVKICTMCGFNGSSTAHKTCANEIGGKRCNGVLDITMTPEINVQIIIDEIKIDKEEEVVAAADTINSKITAKEFSCNMKQCENWFGSRCPYYNYCHNNKEMTGLTKVGKK